MKARGLTSVCEQKSYVACVLVKIQLCPSGWDIFLSQLALFFCRKSSLNNRYESWLLQTVVHTLLDGLKESKSLVDLHYTVGALSTIKVLPDLLGSVMTIRSFRVLCSYWKATQTLLHIILPRTHCHQKHHWSLESHSFAQAVTGIISQVKVIYTLILKCSPCRYPLHISAHCASTNSLKTLVSTSFRTL